MRFGYRSGCQDDLHRTPQDLTGEVISLAREVVARRRAPVDGLGGVGDAEVDVAEAVRADGAGEAGLEEVADEGVGADDVARAWTALAEEAVPLARLDERAGSVFIHVGGDRAQ